MNSPLHLVTTPSSVLKRLDGAQIPKTSVYNLSKLLFDATPGKDIHVSKYTSNSRYSTLKDMTNDQEVIFTAENIHTRAVNSFTYNKSVLLDFAHWIGVATFSIIFADMNNSFAVHKNHLEELKEERVSRFARLRSLLKS
jgi:hypothetical protein